MFPVFVDMSKRAPMEAETPRKKKTVQGSPKNSLDNSEKNGSQQTLLAGRAEISRQDPALTLQGCDGGQDHLGELVFQELAGNFGFSDFSQRFQESPEGQILLRESGCMIWSWKVSTGSFIQQLNGRLAL